MLFIEFTVLAVALLCAAACAIQNHTIGTPRISALAVGAGALATGVTVDAFRVSLFNGAHLAGAITAYAVAGVAFFYMRQRQYA
jgi:hypothetical protein